MSNDEILSKIRDIMVEQLGVEESEVVEGASFQEDLDADSLDLVELIMELEDQFDIKIRDIMVEQLGVEESEVVEGASFQEDLDADSLDLVELIMELEDQFDIKISDEQAEKIATVGDAVKFIAENA